MVAKRRIAAGEEISDNYGIHHLSLTVEERQEALLKGFAFCCWCTGCQKDFPRMKSLRSQLPEELEDKVRTGEEIRCGGHFEADGLQSESSNHRMENSSCRSDI